VSEDNDANQWQKINNIDKKVGVLEQRVNTLEDMGGDVRHIKDRVDNLALDQSHREGASAGKKWMIATMISAGGFVIMVLTLIVRTM